MLYKNIKSLTTKSGQHKMRAKTNERLAIIHMYIIMYIYLYC